jgi:hypothetical protein
LSEKQAKAQAGVDGDAGPWERLSVVTLLLRSAQPIALSTLYLLHRYA